MGLSLSTHWNAGRHTDGRAMIEEILDLGLDEVELGYDLHLGLVPGVMDMLKAGAVRVTSLHNFCPVPVAAPRGHPELYRLASPDRRERASAVAHTLKTVEFAAATGARAVVVHAGYADLSEKTSDLIAMAEKGELFSPAYDRLKMKMLTRRQAKAPQCVDDLCRSLEQLLPTLESTRVALGIELLPAWESVPSEQEMLTIAARLPSEFIRFWYDAGHARIRDNLGFVAALRWLERLQPFLAGVHLHDVAPPAADHLMPPRGAIDFQALAARIPRAVIRVVEPAPGTPSEDVRAGLQIMRAAFAAAWGEEAA